VESGTEAVEMEIHKSKFSLQCTHVLLIKLEGRGCWDGSITV
jgi:hypothetical protein